MGHEAQLASAKFLRYCEYKEAMSLEGWGAIIRWEPKPDILFSGNIYIDKSIFKTFDRLPFL